MSTTIISDLVSGIETVAGQNLGADYSKISYGIIVDANRNRAAEKAYAVLPQGALQDDSIGKLVMDQVFLFRLTDTFMPGKLNDHAVQAITNSLYDKVYTLYDYIVKNKCGKPALVMHTFGLDVQPPEYSENVVTINFTFTVKHRLT